MTRMHAIEVNRSRIKLDVVKALLPSNLGATMWHSVYSTFWCTLRRRIESESHAHRKICIMQKVTKPALLTVALLVSLTVSLPAGGAVTPMLQHLSTTRSLRASLRSSPETKRVLHILELSLQHERRAQQELVYLMSTRVLDAPQWCTVAAALYPLHFDLEPLLGAIVALPEGPAEQEMAY